MDEDAYMQWFEYNAESLEEQFRETTDYEDALHTWALQRWINHEADAQDAAYDEMRDREAERLASEQERT